MRARWPSSRRSSTRIPERFGRALNAQRLGGPSAQTTRPRCILCTGGSSVGSSCYFTALTILPGTTITCAARPRRAVRRASVSGCGGDTLWSSMTAAYDALPETMKNVIDGLKAGHDWERELTGVVRRGEDGEARYEETRRKCPLDPSESEVSRAPDSSVTMPVAAKIPTTQPSANPVPVLPAFFDSSITMAATMGIREIASRRRSKSCAPRSRPGSARPDSRRLSDSSTSSRGVTRP